MSPAFFDLGRIAPTPWKNGLGVTREIAACPVGTADFEWRLSVAEVERDAPFSAFPGVDRCIVLLRGSGMRLRSADGSIDHALDRARVPFRFSGDVPLEATLIDGPCSDFNAMVRRGAVRCEVTCHEDAVDVAGGDAAMVLCLGGAWRVDAHRLEPMQGLLWQGGGALSLPGPRRALAVVDGDGAGARRAVLVARLYKDRP